MYFGMPFGAFGDPDYHVQDMVINYSASGLSVSILAPTGLGGAYYQLYINNIYAASVYVPEGNYSEPVTLVAPAANEYQVTAFRVGPDSSIDLSTFAKIYDTGASSVTAEWSWAYEVIGTADSDNLTAWAVTGLTVSRVLPASKPTRGTIPVSLVVDAGTATVTLGTLAQGSGAVGGSVTLTQLNASGVSGSVTVDAGATTESSNLSIRWPRSMSILRNVTSPPSTEIASVPFGGFDTGTHVDSVDPGTYYYAFRGVSDTDDIGDQSAPVEVTVSGAPVAPSDLAYDSGGASATVIEWTGSTTVGATYNIYVQGIGDEYMDTGTPTQTAIAGSTEATLPAITGYPGKARVVVRAVSGGIEEKNLNVLTLEYDAAGAIVSARPNVPQIQSISVSSGLTVAVNSVYNSTGENATPTKINLYTRALGSSYNFATADATATIATAIDGERNTNISYTFLADGWYYCTTKAETAGGQESAGYAPEVAVYVSDENITAPTGTFTASRG